MMSEPSTHFVGEAISGRSTVVERLRAVLPAILRPRPVVAAYLYGSFADGRVLPDSDIDIALVLAPGSNLTAYERMLLELDVAAEIDDCDFDRTVDVRIINDAPLVAQGTVLTDGICVYSGDDALREEYEVLTRKLYFDFLPTLQMMRRAYFQRKGKDLRSQGLSRHG